jgi:TM2 domain-containing membrane protein YozV
MNIYIIKNNEAQGPFSLDQTVESIRNGEHSLSSLAWREGMADWQPVHALTDIVQAVLPPIPATPQEQKVQTTPPPIPTQLEHNENPQPPALESSRVATITAPIPEIKAESDRCRIPAILLCLFLGGLGTHAFYAGRTKEGIVLAALFAFGVFTLSSGLGAVLFTGVGIYLVIISFRIALGKYTDGQGRIITKWI